jgi:hypothetical protein
MEWLFLTCHNYWIVCRLVEDDNHPYLAYSPKISIEDSSEPFRAFLGSILSVVRDFPVVAGSTYSPDMQLESSSSSIVSSYLIQSRKKTIMTIIHRKMAMTMVQDCIVIV